MWNIFISEFVAEINTGVYNRTEGSDYRWKEYMMMWCGYSVPVKD